MSQNDTIITYFQICNLGVKTDFCLSQPLFLPFLHTVFVLDLLALVAIIVSYFYYSKMRCGKWFVFNSVTIVQIFLFAFALVRVIGYGLGVGGSLNLIAAAFFFAFGFPCLLSAYLYLVILWAELYNAASAAKSAFLSKLAVPFIIIITILFLVAGTFEFLAKSQLFNFAISSALGTVANAVDLIVIVLTVAVIIHFGLRLFRRLNQYNSSGARGQILIKITILIFSSAIVAIIAVVAIVVPLALGRAIHWLLIQRILEVVALFIILGVTVISPKNTKQSASKSKKYNSNSRNSGNSSINEGEFSRDEMSRNSKKESNEGGNTKEVDSAASFDV